MRALRTRTEIWERVASGAARQLCNGFRLRSEQLGQAFHRVQVPALRQGEHILKDLRCMLDGSGKRLNRCDHVCLRESLTVPACDTGEQRYKPGELGEQEQGFIKDGPGYRAVTAGLAEGEQVLVGVVQQVVLCHEGVTIQKRC